MLRARHDSCCRARAMLSRAALVVLALSARVASAQPDDKPPPPPDPAPAPAPAPTPTPTPTPAPPSDAPVTNPPDARVNSLDVVSYGNPRGFRFGSYGRVIVGTDLRGGKPEEITIVAHPPRIVESSYLELDFSYGFETAHGVRLRPVVTLAFDGTLFHDTGQFDAHPALRNMFLDAQLDDHFTLWVGSRMYRGDDIYLLDYWPLDNQNTVGAGVFYKRAGARAKDVLEVAVHAGANRLIDPDCLANAAGPSTQTTCYQYQETLVPNPTQGATTVVQLNRERMVASATASYLMDPGTNGIGAKVKVHAQVEALGSGTSKLNDGSLVNLPDDSGVLIGAELSLFDFNGGSKFRRHLNVFARYASGLATYDELAPPTSFGTDLRTTKASELSFGISANWDARYGNMMFGMLSRRYSDATGMPSFATGWEYVVDARPLAKLARDWFVGADVSYQARFPEGINPITLRAEDAGVFQVAPMIVFSPMGPSAYDRPQIRAVYRAAHLDQGALDLYVPDDQRHGHPWQHFLGFEAEWWFNSSTYR
jgi:maltoporin